MSGMKWVTSILACHAFVGALVAASCLAALAQEHSNREPSVETLAALKYLKANQTTLAANNLRRIKVGDLNLPSGRVVAVDPLTLFGAERPFSTSVKPGIYPVFAYTSVLRLWGERVTLAEVRFSDSETVEWRIALPAGQDVSTLKDREEFGYGVDSGLGSFMSPEAVAALTASKKMAEAEIPKYSGYYSNILSKDLDKSRPSITMHEPAFDPTKNIAIFDSGIGDGVYPSYFGYNEEGEPVVLVTTFFIADSALQEETK
jgi:Protein of unknown function (DUF4241)